MNEHLFPVTQSGRGLSLGGMLNLWENSLPPEAAVDCSLSPRPLDTLSPLWESCYKKER